MKLEFLLQILSEFDVESEIEFDVKNIDSILDFGTLSDIYEDNGAIIFEIR